MLEQMILYFVWIIQGKRRFLGLLGFRSQNYLCSITPFTYKLTLHFRGILKGECKLNKARQFRLIYAFLVYMSFCLTQWCYVPKDINMPYWVMYHTRLAVWHYLLSKVLLLFAGSLSIPPQCSLQFIHPIVKYAPLRRLR